MKQLFKSKSSPIDSTFIKSLFLPSLCRKLHKALINNFKSCQHSGFIRASATSLSKCQGFSLIECLITLVILAIGILGLMSLQLHSLRTLKHSYQHTQAILLATDMANRMLINKAGAELGYYTKKHSVAHTPTKDCHKCDAEQAAKRDIDDWAQQLINVSKSSSTDYVGKVSGDGKSFIISVAWPIESQNVQSDICPINTQCFLLNIEI